MKKGLIFDMDGTLWNSSENVALSWVKGVKFSGYDNINITKEDIMGVMGLTMDAIADRLFASLAVDDRKKLLKVCCDFENEYLRLNGGELYASLEETLKILINDYDLYIVSNCQQGYIEAFLEYYKFCKYFKDIECYGNNLKSKGENIALLAMRNDLDAAYYIGDIEGDYQATINADKILANEGKGQVHFIHAKYGFGTISSPVPYINSFSELPAKLKEVCF